MEYPKINTLFKRDSSGIIIPSEYAMEEFKYLENNIFECTEKIDGTNVRIEIFYDKKIKDISVRFRGRTDNANLPLSLHSKLNTIFDKEELLKVLNVSSDDINCNITIFGEGYGHKIQSYGDKYIKNDVNFVLFDIKVGDWWLKREALDTFADKMNINIVPIVGYMTILNAIEYTKKGFKSLISEDKSLNAEGLVLKTPSGLLFRNESRIITKIKTIDFIKYYNHCKLMN